jgi:transposase
MLKIANTTVTRDEVWHAFRRAHDARLRERYHCILLLLDGKSCPEIAQWLYRDEETIRRWVHAFHTSGLAGLEREASPGRPA